MPLVHVTVRSAWEYLACRCGREFFGPRVHERAYRHRCAMKEKAMSKGKSSGGKKAGSKGGGYGREC
jgi:hypothetical protein